MAVANLDHAYRFVGTVSGTRTTTDASGVVDCDFPFVQLPADRARRTLNHTDRVLAVHTRSGDHDVAMDGALTQEARIVIVGRGTCAYTVVATRAAIHVD